MSAETKPQKSNISKTTRAGLTLPVARIFGQMKKSSGHKRVSAVSGLYATAAVEYIIKELILQAKECANIAKIKRVGARQIQHAFMVNTSLGAQFGDYTFTSTETLGRATEAILTKEALATRRAQQAEREKARAAKAAAKKAEGGGSKKKKKKQTQEAEEA